MMCNGTLYQLPRLVQAIEGIDSGFLLPTPIANDGRCSDYCGHPTGRKILKLGGALKKRESWLLPTPIARDWKDTPGMARQAGERKREDTLPRKIYAREQSPARSGIINPAFSLWLMGYPAGWLEIS
jgi:hypothetical protein